VRRLEEADRIDMLRLLTPHRLTMTDIKRINNR